LHDDQARCHRRGNRLAGGPSRLGLSVWRLLSTATRQIRVEERCHRSRNRLAGGPSRLGLAVWELLSSAKRQVRIDEHELRSQRFCRDRFPRLSGRVGSLPGQAAAPGLDVSDVVLWDSCAETAESVPRDDGLLALAGFLHTVFEEPWRSGFSAETLE
jgi:hypothetical protein